MCQQTKSLLTAALLHPARALQTHGDSRDKTINEVHLQQLLLALLFKAVLARVTQPELSDSHPWALLVPCRHLPSESGAFSIDFSPNRTWEIIQTTQTTDGSCGADRILLLAILNAVLETQQMPLDSVDFSWLLTIQVPLPLHVCFALCPYRRRCSGMSYKDPRSSAVGIA